MKGLTAIEDLLGSMVDLESSFSQTRTHKIDNNGNIGISSFTVFKQS